MRYRMPLDRIFTGFQTHIAVAHIQQPVSGRTPSGPALIPTGRAPFGASGETRRSYVLVWQTSIDALTPLLRRMANPTC